MVSTHPEIEGAPDLIGKYVRFGASPRGAQGLILAGKVAALMDGRPNVSVDDVRALAMPVLRHRLVLGYEAVADGVSPDALVTAVVDMVPTPTAPLRGHRESGPRCTGCPWPRRLVERPWPSPEFLGRLERLQVATQRPLAGRFAADHRSPRSMHLDGLR